MGKEDIRKAKEEQGRRIRAAVIHHVDESPRRLARYVSDKLDVPVAHVYVEIQALVREGLLCCEGRTARKRYWLSAHGKQEKEEAARRTYAMPGGRKELSVNDAELLERKPRNVFEAERRNWLLRKFGRTPD